MMKKTNWIFSVCLGLASLFYSTEASCYEDCCEMPVNCCDSGLYFGTQVGYVNTNWYNADQNSFNNSEIIIRDDYGCGVRPYIGYALNQYLGVEFGWTYLNNANVYRWNALGFDNQHLTKITMQAYDASLRLSVPVMYNAGLFARVGVSYLKSNGSIKWRFNSTQAFGAEPIRHNPSVYNLTFAFGAFYELTCKLRAEVSWTRFGGNPEATDNYQPSPDFYSFGLTYKL